MVRLQALGALNLPQLAEQVLGPQNVELLSSKYRELDSTVSEKVFGTLSSLGFELRPGFEPLHHLPFVASPTPLLIAITGYLVVTVLSCLNGKLARFAGIKKPNGILLKLLMQMHNLFLVGLSTYMCLGIVYEAWKNQYVFWGNAFNPSELAMARLIYIFYVSKIYEFGDTMFMLAKGNFEQVSLLHVYHHASISVIWWMITYAAPGGDAYFSAALNSFVHILMYLYYFTAATLSAHPNKKRYLWWGKYLTQFQMLQFVLNLCQGAYNVLFKRPYSIPLSKLLFYYMISLLVLFGHFYYNKHMKYSRKAHKQKTT